MAALGLHRLEKGHMGRFQAIWCHMACIGRVGAIKIPKRADRSNGCGSEVEYDLGRHAEEAKGARDGH